MKIIWAITGAGHLLRESIEVLEKLSQKHQITITTTNAAQEVLQLYGQNTKIQEILEKNPENQLITEKEQQHSYPFAGKITHTKYDLIILSPTTANTTAKIVTAIADNLITNIIAQSAKAQIPAIIIPVDQKEGPTTTILPPHINKTNCTQCNKCIPACNFNAINPPHINQQKCTYCKKCEKTCPQNAIKIGEEITLHIRKIDAQNAKKLEEIENITTTTHPYNITRIIKKIEEKKKEN